ncbi:MAG TPA: lysylphosphatidylglycerol synthase transmembrane domain-containing protein [Roseiflexaceae bacterium]|nr:lysylphosphatidylglycerol synthase transmembrane domain-containing protein [Roseiflexaceae bacterium]
MAFSDECSDPSAPATRGWPRWLRLAAVMVVLILAVTFFVDTHTVWATLLGAQPVYLAGCLAIYFAGVVLSCVKWQLLLQTQGLRAPLAQLVRWYLLGALASSVLPSDVGGDLGRGYIAGRALGDHAAAWSSVVVERLTGLAALLLLAALALALAPTLLGWPMILPLGLLAAGVAGGAVVGVALRPGSSRMPWLPISVGRVIGRLQEIAARYRSSGGILAVCLVLSVAFHVLNAVSLWLLARTVASDVAPGVMLVWPLVGLVGLLPLTPGGLGVREGAMAVLLGRAGMSAEQAVAAALLSRALLLVGALAGLPPLLDALQRGRRRPLRLKQE